MKDEILPWTIYVCFLRLAVSMGIPVKDPFFPLFYLILSGFQLETDSLFFNSTLRFILPGVKPLLRFFCLTQVDSEIFGKISNQNRNSGYSLPL